MVAATAWPFASVVSVWLVLPCSTMTVAPGTACSVGSRTVTTSCRDDCAAAAVARHNSAASAKMRRINAGLDATNLKWVCQTLQLSAHAESWNRWPAQRRQVDVVQCRDAHPGRRGGKLSLLHHRPEHRHRNSTRRAPG